MKIVCRIDQHKYNSEVSIYNFQYDLIYVNLIYENILSSRFIGSDKDEIPEESQSQAYPSPIKYLQLG